MFLRGALDPRPGFVTFRIAHAFDLVEPRDCVAHMRGVAERLLALLGKCVVAVLEFLPVLGVEFAHRPLLSGRTTRVLGRCSAKLTLVRRPGPAFAST